MSTITILLFVPPILAQDNLADDFLATQLFYLLILFLK